MADCPVARATLVLPTQEHHEPHRHRAASPPPAALAPSAAWSPRTSPAALADDDDRVRRGSCSGSTDWKIKVGPEDGRLEVEGEVDSNRSGQTWRWRLRPQRLRLRPRDPAPPAGRSGSFEVRRVSVDLARHRRVRLPGPQRAHRRGVPRNRELLSAVRAPYWPRRTAVERRGEQCATRRTPWCSSSPPA